MPKAKTEMCSCPDSCCPSTKEEEKGIKWLLRIMFTEWVIMVVLAGILIAKMANMTYLEDEDRTFYFIYIGFGLFLICGSPFVVGLHTHTQPSCACEYDEESDDDSSEEDSEAESSSTSSSDGVTISKKTEEPEYTLFLKEKRKSKKKKQKKVSDSSSDEKGGKQEKRKTKSKKRKTKSKKGKTKSKKDLSNIVIDKDIFMTGVENEEQSVNEDPEDMERAVKARLEISERPAEKGEKDPKQDVKMGIVVDPDSKTPMYVGVQAELSDNEMKVDTKAVNEDGAGKAEIRGEMKKGAAKDKDKVMLEVVSEDTDSDEMTLNPSKKSKKKKNLKKSTDSE